MDRALGLEALLMELLREQRSVPESLNRPEDTDSSGASRNETRAAIVVNRASYAQAPERRPDI